MLPALQRQPERPGESNQATYVAFPSGQDEARCVQQSIAAMYRFSKVADARANISSQVTSTAGPDNRQRANSPRRLVAGAYVINSGLRKRTRPPSASSAESDAKIRSRPRRRLDVDSRPFTPPRALSPPSPFISTKHVPVSDLSSSESDEEGPEDDYYGRHASIGQVSLPDHVDGLDISRSSLILNWEVEGPAGFRHLREERLKRIRAAKSAEELGHSHSGARPRTGSEISDSDGIEASESEEEEWSDEEDASGLENSASSDPPPSSRGLRSRSRRTRAETRNVSRTSQVIATTRRRLKHGPAAGVKNSNASHHPVKPSSPTADIIPTEEQGSIVVDGTRKSAQNETYICPSEGCPASFGRFSDMKRHFERHVTSDTAWICMRCEKASCRRDALRRHCELACRRGRHAICVDEFPETDWTRHEFYTMGSEEFVKKYPHCFLRS